MYMVNEFLADLSDLVKKHDLESRFNIPSHLLVDLMFQSVSNASIFLNRLEDFREDVNDALEQAAIEGD